MHRQKEIESAAQEWLEDIPENVSEYEKIKYLYEQIVWRTEYQEGGTDDQNIYSVLQNGESVCAGYAKTMQYLAGKVGIFCHLCDGDSNRSGYRGDAGSCMESCEVRRKVFLCRYYMGRSGLDRRGNTNGNDRL